MPNAQKKNLTSKKKSKTFQISVNCFKDCTYIFFPQISSISFDIIQNLEKILNYLKLYVFFFLYLLK